MSESGGETATAFFRYAMQTAGERQKQQDEKIIFEKFCRHCANDYQSRLVVDSK